jgi:multiple sugar transport system ATP-binding protein
MAGVTLENVRKAYENGFVAVHGIDLVVEDGEFVVLVGPSGCGKSTTLRMVAGLETPSAGRLLIGDRVVNDVPPSERDIAMVFQSYALYPHMSVYENLAFALRLRKLAPADVEARVRRAANVLGIDSILDRTPRQLSGGQRQRVAIGRAIVREPRVFLFDEPLSNLDAKLRVHMRREIARLHRELATTVIYVTHDQVEAMTLGDRIVVMNAGRVEQVGAPIDVYDHPRTLFVASFIGSPAMNLLEGTLRAEGGTISFVADRSGVALPVSPASAAQLRTRVERRVTAGIRPEDLRVANGDAQRAADEASIDIVIDGVEPLGNEALVYARAAGQELVARTALRQPHLGVDRAALRVAAHRIHYFDRDTGDVIATAEST